MNTSTNPGARCSVSTRCIDWPAAAQALQAAVVQAEALGRRVNVALVDPAGTLAGFLRMPGAPLHSVEIAIDKAYTAASFGIPTAGWSELLATHSAAVRDGLVRRPRFVAFGGGLPLVEQGVCIGAIGVSGASEDEDERIARAGARAIGLA
ncbi:GlcG/HbpS family heme-binding protein [Caldimonas tepidiphila]|uniref:GlcG/HbpS family heme-binding protein n=1 Tax=Caldimonas tepidiphila TaxID=2315841 RepID=UPI000E5AF944|nr:heme-binding protein [Caldimonas tepidiphila]